MMMTAEIIKLGIEHGMEAATDLQFRGMYEELTEPELEALNALLAFARAIEDRAIADMNARQTASWTKVGSALVAVEREACAKLVERFGNWDFTWVLAAAIRARGNT